MIPSDPQEDEDLPDPVPGPEDPVEDEDDDPALEPETGNPEPTDPANPGKPA